jgi:mono/diheme cytochrome c family protein
MRTTVPVLLAFVLVCGCAKALPDQRSPGAQLYAARCGSCHQLYAPRSLTPAMWEIQVNAMQDKIIAAGQPPLTPAENKTILDYLKRNAGTQ